MAPTVRFYDKLNEMLAKVGFEAFVAAFCRPCYAAGPGHDGAAEGRGGAVGGLAWC